MSNIQSLQEVVQKFCENRDWNQFHHAKDLAIGVSTEASELLELFRFKSNEEISALFNDPQFRSNVSDEIADVFFFVLRFCQKYDIDLEKSFLAKLDKNSKKYPIEKAKSSNKKYDEL